MPEVSAENPGFMDHTGVDAWLAAYVSAWKSYDAQEIGDLFSENAEYRYHPYDDPVRGREAIVASWLEQRDPAGTYDAEYHAVVVEGDRAAAQGWSRYFESDGSSLKAEWHNLFLLRFDLQGRCAQFSEWYIRRPEPTSDTPSS